MGVWKLHWSTTTDRALNPAELPRQLLASSVRGEAAPNAEDEEEEGGGDAAEERKHLCLHGAAPGFPPRSRFPPRIQQIRTTATTLKINNASFPTDDLILP